MPATGSTFTHSWQSGSTKCRLRALSTFAVVVLATLDFMDKEVGAQPALFHNACTHVDLCFVFLAVGGGGGRGLHCGACFCAAHIHFLQFDPKHLIVPKELHLAELHLNAGQIQTRLS